MLEKAKTGAWRSEYDLRSRDTDAPKQRTEAERTVGKPANCQN